MAKFPVGIQLYSVRDAMEKDFENTIKQIAEMGYDCVEFAGTFGKSASEVKAICDKNNIMPVSAHVSYDEIKVDPEKIAEYYAEVGVKFVVIPWLDEEYRPGTDGYEGFKADVNKIGEIMKKHGITLGYHNHDFEFEKLDGEYLLDIMYKDIDADHLETQIDTCWVNVGGENPAEYLKKYKGRAHIVHIKDFAGQKSDNMYALIGKDDNNDASEKKAPFEFRPVGYGVQDVKAILSACREAGADYIVIEQDQASMGLTSMECAKKSFDYIKTVNN